MQKTPRSPSSHRNCGSMLWEPVHGANVLPWMRGSMSKRELIDRELDRLPEQDLDRLLAFVRLLKEAQADAAMPTLAAESALAKDGLTAEENAAWANL